MLRSTLKAQLSAVTLVHVTKHLPRHLMAFDGGSSTSLLHESGIESYSKAKSTCLRENTYMDGLLTLTVSWLLPDRAKRIRTHGMFVTMTCSTGFRPTINI